MNPGIFPLLKKFSTSPKKKQEQKQKQKQTNKQTNKQKQKQTKTRYNKPLSVIRLSETQRTICMLYVSDNM